MAYHGPRWLKGRSLISFTNSTASAQRLVARRGRGEEEDRMSRRRHTSESSRERITEEGRKGVFSAVFFSLKTS